MKFYYDIDPVTLVLKLDLDIVKNRLHTEDEVFGSSSSKAIVWRDIQTDEQTQLKLLSIHMQDGNNFNWSKILNKTPKWKQLIVFTVNSMAFMEERVKWRQAQETI